MPRETKDIIVGDHQFKVKTYATAREANEMQQAYFRGTKVELVGDQPKISEFNPAIQAEVQKEMVKQMVVEADGKTGDILDYCLDLPNDIYLELVGHLDALVAKKKS